MTFISIPSTDIEVGDVITSATLLGMKQNLDDLNARLAASSGLPIGTVIHSMLTLAQLQSSAGPGWVLSSGQSCVGSAYHAMTGFSTVPDMRGRVLRGKNNGSSSNPGGDLALGTYQADAYGSHTHTFGASLNVGTFNNNTSYPGWVAQGVDNIIASGVTASGGNETRMKNITVNIFIKIN